MAGHFYWWVGISVPFSCAVCIMDQVVLMPASYLSHAVRVRGWENRRDISCAPGGLFFGHLCTMLNGFLAGCNLCTKSVCCCRLKECIRVIREHPLIAGSDQGFCAIMWLAVIRSRACSLAVCSDLVCPWTSLLQAPQRS